MFVCFKTCMQWSPETEDTARFNLKTTTVEILFLKIIKVQLKANKSHYTVSACTVLSSHLAVSKFRYSAGDSHVSYVIWRSFIKQKYFLLVPRVKQTVLLPGG